MGKKKDRNQRKLQETKIPRISSPRLDVVPPSPTPDDNNPYFPFRSDVDTKEDITGVEPDDNMIKYTLDKDLEDLLRNIFAIRPDDSNHELLQALAYESNTTWKTFIRLQPEAIELLSKKADRGTRVPISKSIIMELKVLLQYIRERIDERRPQAKDINTYKAEDFEEYLDEHLRTKKENAVHGNAIISPLPTKNNFGKSKTEKDLDNWERKKHDKTNFDILKEDSKYKMWKETFIDEIKVQGLERMIDDSFNPKKDIVDAYDRELFQKQSNYFWTVLNYSMKNPIAEIILGKHRHRYDARTAFLAVDNKMKNKISQMYSVGTLSDTLRDLHISTYSGSRVQFIAEWFGILRQLNRVAEKEDQLSYIHVRSQVMRAINTDPDLTNSFTELKDEPDRDVALVQLMEHLLDKATLYDGRDGSSVTSHNKKIVALLHQMGASEDIDEDDIELLINKNRRNNGPPTDCKLPDNVYHCFSRDDKIKWRELSDDAKRAVVSMRSQPSETPQLRRSYYHATEEAYKANQHSQGENLLFERYDEQTPVQTVNALRHSLDDARDLLHALEAKTDTSSTGTDLSSITSRSRPPPSNSNSSKSDNDKKKTSLGRSHPARLMATMTQQQQHDSDDVKDRVAKFHGTTFRQYKHSIHFNDVTAETDYTKQSDIEYSVSKRKINHKTSMSLIDRGANGCVAGADCKLIGLPEVERTVNITGMDEHQLVNIPIATVGAYTVSNRGPVICVFQEVAYNGKHQSIISALQMEHFKNRVDDRCEMLGGGQQITTSDGYNFPLSIVNGLPYLQMRPFTNKEYETLPHVIMTSSQPWDPRMYDNYVDPESNTYKQVKEQNLHLLPHDEYNVKGEYIGVHRTDVSYHNKQMETWVDQHEYQLSETVARCIHGVRNDSRTDSILVNEYELQANSNPRTHIPNEQDYKKLQPYFAWIPTKLIKHTFSNSTQYGFMPTSPNGNLFKRWKSPNPAMNVFRLQDDILTDKIHSNTPAIDGGFKTAQIFFGRKSHIIHPEIISKRKSFLRCIQNFVRTWGAPFQIIADHIRYHESFQVLDYLRILWIKLWFSEAYYQHQNPFERRYQTFKRIVNRTMDRTGTPPQLWYLCICYVAYVLNRVSDPTLNYRQPIAVATGNIGDISAITTFQWLEPVYFKLDGRQFTFPNTGEGFGYFVGIAENVGHEMTYKIWNPSTNKIVDRSSVRSANDVRFPNKRALQEFANERDDNTRPQEHGLDTDTTTQNNGEDFKIPDTRNFIFGSKDDPKVVTNDDTKYGENNYFDQDTSDDNKPDDIQTISFDKNGSPMVVLVDEDGNPRIDSEGKAIMIPGKTSEELKGITFKQRQEDGSVLRARVLGPTDRNLTSEEGRKVLDKFRIKYDRTQMEAIVDYNQIINLLYKEETEGENYIWKYRKILSHRGPITHRDNDYKKSRYNVSVEWENGEITEEPLNWMIKEDPANMADYARRNNLLETEGWRQLKRLANRTVILERQIRQAKLRSFRTATKYMYGYQVPRDYQEAMELDKQNGNDRWSKATSLEMEQLKLYEVFIDMGPYHPDSIPNGFKKIRVHLVFAVKHDGRHKARLVADGHLTDVPLNSVYAGVVSIRGLRLCIFLAELNGLEAHATDIGNAYLEALTQEKVCIKAGPEFGELEGHMLVVYKALYGLRSSGKQFGDLLAACLRELGFKPSKAEPQIFLRKTGNLYEYIATYVDDLCLVMRKPEEFLSILQGDPYNFKLKGSGPMSFHLGCGFERDENGTLCMNPRKYVEKLLQSYRQLFGVKPGTKPRSPLEEGDHPELDDSEFLDDDDTQKYQSIIGSLQWLITLGRWDIMTSVMTLSSFRAKPRKGHLLRARRVCEYINRFKDYKVRFRVDEPDLSEFDSHTKTDWSKDVYEEFSEEIPEDAPEPLGRKVTLVHWFDANLMHDVISGKAVTGCIHYVNKTPMMWHSKKQATSETATYGAEFCAGRTCIEQVVDLRNTLRYLGVPLHEISYIFGDNKSMIDSSTNPQSRLHKRHNILSYHYVRSMIARGYIALVHTNSKDNLADVVTKHWSYNSVKGLLKPVFDHSGNTADLYYEGDVTE